MSRGCLASSGLYGRAYVHNFHPTVIKIGRFGVNSLGIISGSSLAFSLPFDIVSFVSAFILAIAVAATFVRSGILRFATIDTIHSSTVLASWIDTNSATQPDRTHIRPLAECCLRVCLTRAWCAQQAQADYGVSHQKPANSNSHNFFMHRSYSHEENRSSFGNRTF